MCAPVDRDGYPPALVLLVRGACPIGRAVPTMDLQLLLLLLLLLLELAHQPTATVEGELNSNSSSYTVPEGVCFRILRSIEGGTAVSPVRDNSRLTRDYLSSRLRVC